MIRLFTGLPGAGKTAHAVSVALELMKQGRPVYVANMRDMNIPGAIPFEDPMKWEELPPDAVLIVDEAQRFFRASRSLDVPPAVQAMETHRHAGIDFLLTTQQPSYLLKHLRGLVGEHTHHLRRTNGTAQTWTWNAVCDEPDSLSERDRADVGAFVYPKHVFAMYTSTEKDTHKPGIPRKLKFVIGGASILLLLVIFGPGYMKKKTQEAANLDADDAPSAEQPGQGGGGGKRVPLTPQQYSAQLTPRIEGALHTAPMFDGKKVVSEPAIYCMTSGAGTDANGKHRPAGYTCVTEQGTRYDLPEIRARLMARNGGAYNPFKQPAMQQQQQQQGSDDGEKPSGSKAGAIAVTAGGAMTAGTDEAQAAYGRMRNKEHPTELSTWQM